MTADFTELVDLASERIGGAAIAANDEFFASRENLVKPGRPVARDEYTDRGKWMDGWETRRRREPGHDWCVVRLGLPGMIRGVVIDTTHFVGNHPEACSIEACAVAESHDHEALAAGHAAWTEVLPRTAVRGDTENRFAATTEARVTHVRLNIFPDGGVARLRVYGVVVPDWGRVARSGGDVDLAALQNGGTVVAASDMFFGSRHNLILPGPSRGMNDGWETRRRRGPGHDWAIVRLGAAGRIRRVELDTAHFKGNAPGACSIEVAALGETGEPTRADVRWVELLAPAKLEPDTLHRFERELADVRDVTHARLNIFPDGGVARLRLFGKPSRIGA
jgi:allantoicase